MPPHQILESSTKPEIKSLLSWLGSPIKNPRQVNKINESDCEVVALEQGGYVVATVDTLSEEIACGLYQEFETIGWIAAVASASDLGASGTTPIGMLLSIVWPIGTSLNSKKLLLESFHEASRQCGGIPLLGGDHGEGESLVVSTVGIGSSLELPLMRSGLNPGDTLFLIGTVGPGAALALTRLNHFKGEPSFHEQLFRPRPQPRMMTSLRPFFSAAIDLSDGLLGACFDLAEASGCCLQLDWSESTLNPLAHEFFKRRELPLVLAWMSEHGDFNHIVGVPPSKLASFEAALTDKTGECSRYQELLITRLGRVLPKDSFDQSKNFQVSLHYPGNVQNIPRSWVTRSQTQTFLQIRDSFDEFKLLIRGLNMP